MYSSIFLSVSTVWLSLASTVFCLPSSLHSRQQENTPLVRKLYEYPAGTWIENIAVRPSGELLLTLLNKPQLDQLNPFLDNATPTEVHTVTGVSGLSGITEIAPDTFAVAAGNFSFTSGGQVGSWSVWEVEFSTPHNVDATFSKIANMPRAKFLNGMCNLPSTETPNNILIGDIEEGVIRRVDTATGSRSLVLNSTFTATLKDPVFGTSGVNGIHVRDNILYFTNTAKKFFASMPIHPNGTPAGQPSIIQQSRESEEVFYFDDFALHGEDAYLVTGSGNSIERVGLDGTPKGRVIAGALNSTQFAGPTSAAFGRTEKDMDVLYVVTSGGLAAPVDGNVTVGAQVLAVDIRQWPDCEA